MSKTKSMFDELKEEAEAINKAFEEVLTEAEATTEEDSSIYTRANFFKRMLELQKSKLVLMEDIKQLKADFKYGDDNPKGLDKDEVEELSAYAMKVASDKVSKVIEDGKSFEKLKEEFGE